MEKIFPISLQINFIPNTLGCYGLGLAILAARLTGTGCVLRALLMGVVQKYEGEFPGHFVYTVLACTPNVKRLNFFVS